MNIIQEGTAAYMSLTEAEMRRYRFQQGDSEGFVNYPLTIKKMKMSAMFLGHHKFIRVSLRSRGDVDVNLFARKYFDGGGHKNAAGANPMSRWTRRSLIISVRSRSSPARAASIPPPFGSPVRYRLPRGKCI